MHVVIVFKSLRLTLEKRYWVLTALLTLLLDFALVSYDNRGSHAAAG
jgi:hypothetical protein